MDLIQNSILKAGFFTLVVLSIGLLAGLQFDDARTSYIDDQISQATINTESVMAVQNYLETSNNYCRVVEEEIPEMGERNAEIGTTLEQFSSKGVSEGEKYKTLRRRYYVSELRLYNMMSSYRDRCDQDMDLILYFFSDNIESQRQGNVLTEYRREVDNSTSIFTFNYEADDSQVLDVLKTDFNVTGGPTIIVNGEEKHEGYVPLVELEQILQEGNNSVSANKTNQTS